MISGVNRDYGWKMLFKQYGLKFESVVMTLFEEFQLVIKFINTRGTLGIMV